MPIPSRLRTSKYDPLHFLMATINTLIPYIYTPTIHLPRPEMLGVTKMKFFRSRMVLSPGV